jgi:hypothetical protein
LCRRAFTLAEAMIASVVLAASVIGIAGALSASYRQNAIRGNQATALFLAQQLMEEISSRPLSVSGTDLPGWSGGQTNRANYDTIGDYNGYTDLSSSIQASDGSTYDLGDGASYTRAVSVTNNALPAGLSGTSSDFTLVTITVAKPHSQSVSISQLFTKVNVYR